MITPCMGCEIRSIGCHSTCEKYRMWAQDRKERMEKIHNQKTIDNKVESHAFNTHHKIKRSGKKSKILKGTKK